MLARLRDAFAHTEHKVTIDEAEAALRAVASARGTAEIAVPADPADVEAVALQQHAFMPRSPVVSLLQSVLEEQIEKRFGDRVVRRTRIDPAAPAPAATRVLLRPDGSEPDQEAMGNPFTLLDPSWAIVVAEALVQRLLRGRHPFNPCPAPPVEIASNARLVVFSDWGSGIERAQRVTQHAREWLLEAKASGRDAHAVHLGDVYYAGERREYDNHVLAPGMWPVEPEEADEIGSWSLCGNHDMYSGAWAYFDHLLADRRFARQRSEDRKPTSWFELVGPVWRVFGLDTAWNGPVLMHGQWGDLEPPQGAHVAAAAAEDDGRKILLLSHHQLFSAYDPNGVGPTIERELHPALATGRVRAWFWGHEHRCMAFAPHEQLEFGRCIGHGGVPVTAHAESAPIPPPVTWEYKGQFESSGYSWARFGFVVLDFAGATVRVTYVDESGDVSHTEDLV